MDWGFWLIERTTRRPPDFVIGGRENPYLLRWWLTPWRRWSWLAQRDSRLWVRLLGRLGELLPNAYLHHFLRSDDDRALHDHPWANFSVLLCGSYTEHTIDAGGIHRREVLSQGDWRVRWSGKFAHRIELHEGSCWTLFVTGPKYRAWGFHCPDEGWIHWERFTASSDPGSIGRGCDA